MDFSRQLSIPHRRPSLTIVSLHPKLTYERLRQEGCEFEASLSCLIKIVSKKKRKSKVAGRKTWSTVPGGLGLLKSAVYGAE